jgi:hypothetical protein
MAIFRGIGGAGDSTTDATVTAVTEQAVNAATSATQAASSASSAASSASSASTSATNAAASASTASDAATAAQTAQTNAETAETNAETAQAAAEAAQTAAETAETNAETAETNAETAEANAVTAKNSAEAAQTAAETAETNAETAYANTLAIFGTAQDVQDAVDSASASAATATTKASEAAASAANASTSETNSANSASSANTSATNASNSATAASTSESNASTSETNASNSASTATTKASEASASASAALTSETNAATSESNASTSETNAANSASAASTSATNASNSASAASTSETNAASSATAASNSATSASNSATAANNSASAAATSATNAENAYDSFDDRYLGVKASDPALDNDGAALLTGALYFNSTDNEMRVYTGSVWVAVIDLAGDVTVTSLTASSVDINGGAIDGTTIGATTPSTGDFTTLTENDSPAVVQSDIGTDPDEIPLNQYLGSMAYVDADSVNIDGGTIDGVTIGGASAGAGTFTTLTADGLTIEGSAGPLINLYRSDVNALFGAIQFKDTTNTNENARIGWAANELRLQGTDKVSLITDEKTRLFLASTGDISFYDDSGTSQNFYWDASTSRLGLGTTSPATALHLSNISGPTPIIRLEDADPTAENNSLIGALEFYSRESENVGEGVKAAVRGYNSSNNGNGELRFYTGNTTSNDNEVMRIDSLGNVGIGTTSPDSLFHISSGGPKITITDTTFNADATITVNDAGSLTFSADANNERTNSIIQFDVDGSEAMRIDSSGDLLVGTTTSGGNNGHTLNSYGLAQHKRASGHALILDRLTDDGAIATFRKDGTTVGSIGTVAGHLGIAEGDTGLRFEGDTQRIIPANSTYGTRDGLIDLGRTDGRFKDLYLSGGVYLGGTGSTNLLDDYEEGTFTATLASAGNTGATTLTSNVARYTKIGDVVHIFCTVTGDANLCDAGDYFDIGGLPFASSVYAFSRSPFNGVSHAGNDLLDNRVATGVCSVFENSTKIDVYTNVAAIGSVVGETICTLTVCYTVG